MKRAICLLAVVLGGGGCMSEMGGNSYPIPDPGIACVERHGSYNQHFIETNGTCGAIPDLAGNIDDSQPGPGCTVSATTTQQNCHVLANISCTANADGITTKTTLTVNFVADGSQGSGTIYLQLGGTSTCASTYAVTYTAIK
ncbi:MAG: hypothetical protein ABJA82_00595 [Myxococcales bacterium]